MTQFPHARRVLESRGSPVRMRGNKVTMTLAHAENPAPDEPAGSNWRRTIQRAGPALLIILLVVLWQILTRAFDIPKFLLPAPTDIARLMIDEWPLIQMHSLATIGSIVSGYITAVLFALAISALMIRFPLVERLIMPIFVGLQSVPKIAIAPLILVWVGAGMGSKVAVVVSIAFFPIVINTMTGFKEVDRTLAVLGAIVAEWLAASNGLGYLVLSGSFNFNTARSFAAIIVLAVIGTTFFAFMSWLERVISWKREGSDSTTQV